ncbi:MAG: hypothetical protein ACN4GT_12010 [Gammaproteobacteria bacterium]
MKQQRQRLALLCGLALTTPAWGSDAEPDAELIEFLGNWAEETEEWEKFFDSVPQELLDNIEDEESDGRSTDSDSD